MLDTILERGSDNSLVNSVRKSISDIDDPGEKKKNNNLRNRWCV